MNVDFHVRVTAITQALNDGKILKDDITTANKGGIAWKMLSIFTRVITLGHADINKHYRPQTVLVELSKFVATNQAAINQDANLREACDAMLNSVRNSIRKQNSNGDELYAQQISDIQAAMHHRYNAANPAHQAAREGNLEALQPEAPGAVNAAELQQEIARLRAQIQQRDAAAAAIARGDVPPPPPPPPMGENGRIQLPDWRAQAPAAAAAQPAPQADPQPAPRMARGQNLVPEAGQGELAAALLRRQEQAAAAAAAAAANNAPQT